MGLDLRYKLWAVKWRYCMVWRCRRHQLARFTSICNDRCHLSQDLDDLPLDGSVTPCSTPGRARRSPRRFCRRWRQWMEETSLRDLATDQIGDRAHSAAGSDLGIPTLRDSLRDDRWWPSWIDDDTRSRALPGSVRTL